MIVLDSSGIWQWDINHTVTTDTADEIHFAMSGDKEALDVMPSYWQCDGDAPSADGETIE